MSNTIESLRLNIPEAMAGRTWLLLPEGFRDQSHGKTYPLPSTRPELQQLVAIPIPHRKKDAGVLYLLRAMSAWRKSGTYKRSSIQSIVDLERRDRRVRDAENHFQVAIRKAKADAVKAVDEVRQKAQEAVASLSDLFALGRQGIEGQMKAHLAGSEWQGESVSARDFRDCFRMVLQGVKGLGLPSEQRASATDAVMQEIAESLKDTQETVALAPGTDAETEH